MTDIKTYELVSNNHLGLKIAPANEGEWVWYDDHIIIVRKLEQEIQEWKSLCSQFQEELKEAGLYE